MRIQNRGKEEVDRSRVIIMGRSGSKYQNVFVKFSKN